MYGQHYTNNGNPFKLKPFQDWFFDVTDNKTMVLEPFAGANHIVQSLKGIGFNGRFRSYDVDPSISVVDGLKIKRRDTIKKFPRGYKICVSNPPYLSKSSASRRKLKFPKTKYSDLYLVCLDLMLKNCDYVAIILPESFITKKMFQGRLHAYISLTRNYFSDTSAPVGLALFNNYISDDFEVYQENEFLGTYGRLKDFGIKSLVDNKEIEFNNPNGNIGLISVDNSNDRIRFCDAGQINKNKISSASRASTIIKTHILKNLDNDKLILRCNEILNSYRLFSEDVLLTPFKSKRSDGKYRRRLDWETARNIILVAMFDLAINCRSIESYTSFDDFKSAA